MTNSLCFSDNGVPFVLDETLNSTLKQVVMGWVSDHWYSFDEHAPVLPAPEEMETEDEAIQTWFLRPHIVIHHSDLACLEVRDYEKELAQAQSRITYLETQMKRAFRNTLSYLHHRDSGALWGEVIGVLGSPIGLHDTGNTCPLCDAEFTVYSTDTDTVLCAACGEEIVYPGVGTRVRLTETFSHAETMIGEWLEGTEGEIIDDGDGDMSLLFHPDGTDPDCGFYVELSDIEVIEEDNHAGE